MMRLALYVPHFDRRPAGLGTYVHEMCGRLLPYADAVELYTETPDAVPSSWRARVRVHVMPSARVRRGAARLLLRQSWLSTVFPFELRRVRAHVVLAPFHDGMVVPSIPQVVVVHDLTPLVVPSTYFHPFASMHLRTVLPRVLRRSTVVAVSENTRRDLERYLGVPPARVHVVGEGYDRAVFRPRTGEEIDAALTRYGIARPYLLYSGTYAAHKNPGLLVDVLDGCVARGLDVQLVLTGRHDAGEFKVVRDQLRRRRLDDRVVTPGYVERDDLSALMAGAAAFLFPSLYEGFGLAPLEAMASGAVVLCSDRASLPEVVGDGGALLDPTRVGAWVGAIDGLLANPARASSLRETALRRARSFDWDRSTDQLASVLRGAVRLERRPRWRRPRWRSQAPSQSERTALHARTNESRPAPMDGE